MGRELENIDLTVSQRKEIASLLKRYLPDTEVWAYGSRVKFTAKPSSDLDLVAFTSKEQSIAIANLKEAFEESLLPFRVDLFVWDEVPEQFKKNIQEHHIVLKTKNFDLRSKKWSVVKLGEFCTKIGSGATPRGGSKVYLDFGEVFLIRSQNVYNDGFVPEGIVYITDEAAEKLKNVIVEENDILLNITGDSVARVCLAKKEFLPARVNQHVAIIRPNPTEFDPRFLRYQLASPFMQNYLLTLASAGATRNALTKNMIETLDVSKPRLAIQTKIGDLVEYLDDKIELNRRMNETLETMVQALFKSWFVDFDPVIDNALAAGNEIPEALKDKANTRQALGDKRKPLPEEIRKQFPDSFVFTKEMGWIPEGWENGQISDHALIEMGQSPKGDTYNSAGDGIPLVNGPVEFGLYFTNKSKWTTSPTKLSHAGDLIVCVRGSTTGRFVKSDGEYCLGRGVCSIRGKRSQCFVDQLFKSNISKLLGFTTGSTFPNWSRQTLSEFVAIVPRDSLVDIFDDYISPNIKRIESGFLESASLSKLRDTLLPKLLSGELRIPDAEKQMENVS